MYVSEVVTINSAHISALYVQCTYIICMFMLCSCIQTHYTYFVCVYGARKICKIDICI